MPYQPKDQKGPVESPTYDPFQSYQITCLNREYAGSLHGLRFADGVAIAYGLPEDAAAEEQQERIDALLWFWNADGAWQRHINDEGKEYKRTWEPVYVIEPYEQRARRRQGEREDEASQRPARQRAAAVA